MTRRVVNDMPSGEIAVGGVVLDDVAASYSGNRLTRLAVTSGAKTFSRRTGIGRTGGFTLAYDDAGRLSRDGSRDIRSIRYDNGGHPSLVTFGSLSTVSYRRDGLGNLLETVYSERSGGTASVPTFRLGERREYTSGGHVISNSRLVMSRFGGGYFDGSGNPHYYVTDWQGNNIGVVDRNGLLEQRTRSGGLNEYRFPARDYVPVSRDLPPSTRCASGHPSCERFNVQKNDVIRVEEYRRVDKHKTRQ